jgi:GGDEF domain-containing protein
MLEHLEQAMSASKRSHRHGALLFLDLDNFKPLNDPTATAWATCC